MFAPSTSTTRKAAPTLTKSLKCTPCKVLPFEPQKALLGPKRTLRFRSGSAPSDPLQFFTSPQRDRSRAPTMALQFAPFLSTPIKRQSTVYIRAYVRGEGPSKKRQFRVGTIAGLVVDTANWQGGGLTPKAPQAQRDLLLEIQRRIEALQTDLLRKPRHLTKREAHTFLFASAQDAWPRLTLALRDYEKRSTRTLYGVALKSFQTYCKREQPTLDNYTSWVRSLKKSAPTVNTYAAGIRSLLSAIGITVSGKGLRKSEHEKGKDLHALSHAELSAIASLPLDLGGTLQKVRDAFLMACLTSLRHSDWGYFRSEYIGQKVKNQKTGKKTLIPATDSIRAIIQRNGGSIALPVVVNPSLRAIAQLASTTCPSLLAPVPYRGKNVPKWTTITSHVARRTFATLAFEGGASYEALRQHTGHATDAQVAAYVRPIVDAAKELQTANATSNLVLSLSDLGATPKMKLAK